MAKSGKFDAVICIGVVVSTWHAPPYTAGTSVFVMGVRLLPFLGSATFCSILLRAHVIKSCSKDQLMYMNVLQHEKQPCSAGGSKFSQPPCVPCILSLTRQPTRQVHCSFDFPAVLRLRAGSQSYSCLAGCVISPLLFNIYSEEQQPPLGQHSINYEGWHEMISFTRSLPSHQGLVRDTVSSRMALLLWHSI